MLFEHSLKSLLLIPNRCFPLSKIEALQSYGSSANVAWNNLSEHVRKSKSEHGSLSNCGLGCLIIRFPGNLYHTAEVFLSNILTLETSGNWFSSCKMYKLSPMVLKT